MGLGINAMLAVGHWVAGLPGAVSIAPAWPASALILISLGGLWCAIWRQNWRWFGLVPAALGVVLAYGFQAPDLLIARDGETAALRVTSGRLMFVRRARDGYVAAEWLKRDGDARDPLQAIAKPSDGVRCDSSGCIAYAASGEILAFPSRVDALEEDCSRADIVVSAVPVIGPCRHPSLTLQKHQIEAAGGFAVWLSPFRMLSVQAARGVRPWSQPGESEDAPGFQ
jgi:competence protein ComEC